MGNQTRTARADVVVAAAGPVSRQDAPAAGSPVNDVDIVEIWGQDSFPASDPPANW